MEQFDPRLRQRAVERRGKGSGGFDGLRPRAISPRKCRKIGIFQYGTAHSRGVFAFLVHTDRAVTAVVDDEDDHVRTVLDRGCQFLPVHQEITVARQRHDLACRVA